MRARVYRMVPKREESQISALELFRPANLTLTLTLTLTLSARAEDVHSQRKRYVKREGYGR